MSRTLCPVKSEPSSPPGFGVVLPSLERPCRGCREADGGPGILARTCVLAGDCPMVLVEMVRGCRDQHMSVWACPGIHSPPNIQLGRMLVPTRAAGVLGLLIRARRHRGPHRTVRGGVRPGSACFVGGIGFSVCPTTLPLLLVPVAKDCPFCSASGVSR